MIRPLLMLLRFRVNLDETGTIYIEPEGPAYIDSNVPAGTAGSRRMRR